MMYRLIATAARTDDGWQMDVQPRQVPLHSFLGGIDLWEMGIIYHTDIFEDMYLKIDERGPLATAAAMLRDSVNLIR
jgi:homoserine dehydrogenase